nr:hypothetical protein [Tanacetum cinerariifolium]
SDDGVTTSFQQSRNSRTSCSIVKDKYMMKAQVHVSKSSEISDEQGLPRRKHYCQIYQMINFTSGVKCNPENVRSNVLIKLQDALDEEAILEEQILSLMHRFADRFTDRMVEINNLMVLHDHPLIDYGKYALGCMTRADM